MERRKAIMLSGVQLLTKQGTMVTPKYNLPGDIRNLIVSFTGPTTSASLLQISNNVFDTESAYLAGYYDDNGEWHTSTATGYSESYQPVEASTEYQIIGELKAAVSYQNTFGVYFYDSSKNFMSRSTQTFPRNEAKTNFTFTTPAGCAYIRVQSIQDGTSATGYGFNKTNVRCCKSSDVRLFIEDWSYSGYGELSSGTMDFATGDLVSDGTTYRMVGNTITLGGDPISFWSDGKSITARYWGM